MRHRTILKPLALAVATALTLAACGGGGGGNTRPSPPPPTTPPPTTPPPTQTCQDRAAQNFGGPLPCVYPPPRYSGEADNLLVPINADRAHAAGFTGKGVRIGLIDDARIEGYAPLEGKVAWYQDFTGKANEVDPSPLRGHGNAIGALLVGTAATPFKGGVAPDAILHWARICYNNACNSDMAGQAFDALASQGVRLFNFSLGAYNPTNNGFDAQVFAARSRAVLGVDGLVVAGTGNDKASEASSMAVVPRYSPEYAGNWLAATSVKIDSNGNPTTKPDYANACGTAANWCLSAPGLQVFPAVPGTAYTYAADGTSAATAVVTGTAALVWQAFPWMSARNVQQTLLTTATDLGDAGVDAVYGWGLVNAEKAVRGPAQFVGEFNANVTGNSTFANAISGSGRLVKQGGGTLTLDGVHSFAGGTAIHAGSLVLNGEVASGVTVGDGGTFATAGGKVNGDYTASAGSISAIQVGLPLTVTGNANINGTLRLLPSAAGYAVKGTETLLNAGKVNGRFASVVAGSGFFYSGTASYTDTAVNVSLTRISAAATASAIAAPVSVIAGGHVADALMGFADHAKANGQAGRYAQAVASASAIAAAPTAADAMASLSSLTGEIHGTTRTLGVQRGLNDGAALAERTRSLGAFGDTGVWLQADGVDGRQRRDGYNAADYRQSALRVGVDGRVSDALTVGTSATRQRSDATLGGLGGALEGRGNGIAVYARAKVGDQGYITGIVSHDRHTVDTRRTVLVGSQAENVAGQHTDKTTLGRIEGGILLANGITPFMAVGTLQHKQGAFSEQGGAGVGFAADADTLTATFADLGLRFDREVGQWVLGGSISGRRLFSGDDTGFNASFSSAPASFNVAGQPLARNTLRLGGHLFYRSGNGWVWYVNAGGEQASGQSRNAWGAAGVKIGF